MMKPTGHIIQGSKHLLAYSCFPHIQSVLKPEHMMIVPIVCERHGAFIAYFGQIPVAYQLIVKLSEVFCYMAEIYTLPEYRGRGIAPYLKWFTCHVLHKMWGSQVFLRIVRADNRPSLRVGEKVGFAAVPFVRFNYAN